MYYKMQIKMDGEKIGREQSYDLAKIDAAIQKLFLHYGIKQDGSGMFAGPDSGNDLALFFKAIGYLKDKAWFMENVDTWLLIAIDDYHSDWVETEDCKQHYLKQYRKSA